MTSRVTVEDALRDAASEAQVDLDAPAGEQVRFDRASLDRVSRLFRETGGEDRVIRAWNQVLRELLTAGAEEGNGSPDAARHLDGAVALLALKDRLRGGGPRRYRMGPGGELEMVSQGDLDPLDDPWLAERNW